MLSGIGPKTCFSGIAAACRADRDLDRALRVLVAERLRVEHVLDALAEGDQLEVQQLARDPAVAPVGLPDRPEPIDLTVVREEDRVVCRGRLAAHVAAGPAVHA